MGCDHGIAGTVAKFWQEVQCQKGSAVTTLANAVHHGCDRHVAAHCSAWQTSGGMPCFGMALTW